ncbi:MAG TPA: hypothetical protein DDW42_01700 [Desulfobacteraceae bacterium]|nr:hypothetical protein [Desulfobacteraceae bacterium]
MNLALVYKLGREECPGLSNGWCHIAGDDPCNGPEHCPFIYWFRVLGKANLMERQAKENKGKEF